MLTGVCYLLINLNNFNKYITPNIILPSFLQAYLLSSIFLITAAIIDQNFYQVIIPYYACLIRCIVNIFQGAQVLRFSFTSQGQLLDNIVVYGWVIDQRRVIELQIYRNIIALNKARQRNINRTKIYLLPYLY